MAALALACACCGDPAPQEAEGGPAEPAPQVAEESPHPMPKRPLLAAGEWRIAVASGLVSVDAVEAPRRPLLGALAKRAEFELEAAPGEWPPLTLRLDAQPMEVALPLLVGEFEYRADWASEDGVHRLVKLVIGAPRGERVAAGGSALRPGEVSEALERALRAVADQDEAMDPEEALRRMQDADAETRLRAALALEPEDEGLTALIAAIERDPDPRVRAAATVGLEESEELAAVQALVGALDDPSPDVVVEAIDSLEFAGDASLVPSLEPLLAHPDANVRKAAADAIRLLGE
jgi:hypothetical protein